MEVKELYEIFTISLVSKFYDPGHIHKEMENVDWKKIDEKSKELSNCINSIENAKSVGLILPYSQEELELQVFMEKLSELNTVEQVHVLYKLGTERGWVRGDVIEKKVEALLPFFNEANESLQFYSEGPGYVILGLSCDIREQKAKLYEILSGCSNAEKSLAFMKALLRYSIPQAQVPFS